MNRLPGLKITVSVRNTCVVWVQATADEIIRDSNLYSERMPDRWSVDRLRRWKQVTQRGFYSLSPDRH